MIESSRLPPAPDGAAVARQLEEQFSCFIDEHHKELVEQVQQLWRARAGTTPSVMYSGPQPSNVTTPLLSSSAPVAPTLLQDPLVIEQGSPSMPKVQIEAVGNATSPAGEATKARRSQMAAKGAKLVTEVKKAGDSSRYPM